MLTVDVLFFWLVVALIGTAAWQLFGKRFLSFQATERRRRSRNYGRVVSRRHGPGVRLAARVPGA